MKAAGARRKARELALSILYEADIGKGPGAAMSNADHTIQVLMSEWGFNADERARLQAEIEMFGRRLADLYFRHAAETDALIQNYSHEWALDRMPAVDRNIVRLAVFELLWQDEVPGPVVIDEAVGLARELSTDGSPAFVNGLLARILELRPRLAV